MAVSCFPLGLPLVFILGGSIKLKLSVSCVVISLFLSGQQQECENLASTISQKILLQTLSDELRNIQKY